MSPQYYFQFMQKRIVQQVSLQIKRLKPQYKNLISIIHGLNQGFHNITAHIYMNRRRQILRTSHI